MALGAPQLSLSVGCERLVYRDGVPSLVGPQFAVFDHSANMARGSRAMQACRRSQRAQGKIRLLH